MFHRVFVCETDVDVFVCETDIDVSSCRYTDTEEASCTDKDVSSWLQDDQTQMSPLA